MKLPDLDNREYKAYFQFFKDFDEPFFSLVANVECRFAKDYAKKKTFRFLGYLYLALHAANDIPGFSYRDSIPKISFSKLFEKGMQLLIYFSLKINLWKKSFYYVPWQLM